MSSRDDFDRALEGVVTTAWQQHERAKQSTWLVQPSIPILFFGDSREYRRSKLRVLTVALNPSRIEFPSAEGMALCRFPNGNRFASQPARYIDVLNRYFTENPYKPWFGFFEQALNGIGASYYPRGLNTALHTDIASCLATDPTWNDLDHTVRQALAKDGVPLWHSLLTALRPNIVLFSAARAWLNEIAFAPLSGWRVLRTFDVTSNGGARKRPISVEARWYALAETTTLFAYVPASQKPLAGLSHPQKLEAGALIGEAWRAGLR